jgi:chemotaxis protein methyltransferase CheR
VIQGPGRPAAAPEGIHGGSPQISDREFALFQDLIRRTAGIHLSDVKKALLLSRLSRRLRQLGFSTFHEYYDHLLTGNPDECVRMIDCMTTNETRFFREEDQFRFLESDVLPAWRAEADAGRRRRHVRAWCAGCSTGEEPYSLAMVLLHALPPGAGWVIDILATDLSTRALEHARQAVWPLDRASEIPEQYLKPYMLRGTRSQEGRMKAGPKIRALVRFERLNLNDERYAVAGPFDLVLCRNVLIYFDEGLKSRVIGRLLDLLGPDGYLLTGHAEGLVGLTARLRTIRPSIFAAPAAGGRPRT